jgi:hypothetical protein
MPKPRGNKKKKKLKPVLHIFCEGAKTEPHYFNGYLKEHFSNNRLLKVIRVEKTNKNTPIQLVEEATRLKTDRITPAHDVFWVVYDREATNKYSNNLHKQALDKAKGNDINVCITNVCFEVWILLHINEVNAPYSSCNDLLKNSSLKTYLKTHGIRNYDKANENVFELILNEIPNARRRAKKMNSETLKSSYETDTNPHLLNPYTQVHELLDAIDEFAKGI